MMAPRMADGLYFLPLGGCEEIGMNVNLYACAGKWLIVDLGVTFADDRLPGVDLVLPDISFLDGRQDDILGIVLTHAHEDHFGAVGYLWPRLRCPVYATPFTAELLARKLDEAGLLNEVPVHVVPLGGRLELGPFDLSYINLTHSIPEPNALAIRTPHGTILHTGDWKLDPEPLLGATTDIACLEQMGTDGVLALVCDSTNVFEPGHSGSESQVRTRLMDLIGGLSGGRVAATAFSSNVARIVTLAQAGAAAGRQVVLVGRSLKSTVAAARRCGYLHDMPPLLDETEAGGLPAERAFYICTGSQGEIRGALARIAAGEHPNVSLGTGDSVIFSSRRIPGNERGIARLYNRLAALGVRVVTEVDDLIHVSGHPCRDELAQMYRWARPRIAIPVHGERRHLNEHAQLARSLQVGQALVPTNGSLIRLAPGPAEIVDQVVAGRLVVDGICLVPADGAAMTERRRLLYNGHLAISLTVNGAGVPLAPVRVSICGVPMADAPDETLTGQVEAAVHEAVNGLDRRIAGNDEKLSEVVRIAARRACRAQTGKRPVTKVHLTRLGADHAPRARAVGERI